MNTAGKFDLMPQSISRQVLLERYVQSGENSLRDIRIRVAQALAVNEQLPVRATQEASFLWAMENGFIPGGRINAGAGVEHRRTLINCFVQPVGDSIYRHQDGLCGIFDALKQSMETMRLGGGVGYNFSHIRPKGAAVGGTGALASGPVSFMRIFDISGNTIASAGNRRGAQMGVLDIDHPDIEDFITAKQAAGNLENLNLSVAISDAFMQALFADTEVELVHAATPGSQQIQDGAYRRSDGLWVYDKVPARQIWERIMRTSYNCAEPGVLFTGRIAQDNNLAYCESIQATNPCGEQPLPNYGCCCLGSLNLAAFINDPFQAHSSIDKKRLVKVTRIAVRMLDNALDVSHWPLPQQHREARSKRRIGLGVTGLGDALLLLGLAYSSNAARTVAADLLKLIRDTAYATSTELARERGPFPLFDDRHYALSGFAERLPIPLRTHIQRYGIRNSHLISVAPAGTISIAFADNVSNGIEPPFAWTYHRRMRQMDGRMESHEVEDYAYRLYRHFGFDTTILPDFFKTAQEISPHDHLLMIAAIAPYVDAGISKTVNVSQDLAYEDYQSLYGEAWKLGLKGLTTFRPNAVHPAILVAQEHHEQSTSGRACQSAPPCLTGDTCD